MVEELPATREHSVRHDDEETESDELSSTREHSVRFAEGSTPKGRAGSARWGGWGGARWGRAGPACRIQLGPGMLLGVFVYANLLNYVDRGLVAGTLPTFCVSCNSTSMASADECAAQTSCEWEGGACHFNATVRPQFGIGGSFGISETEQGILAGAFMGGYCAFSPVFALASSHFPPFALMSLGLFAWVMSCIMAATSPTYHGLLIARVVSGIGEASFQCLAPPFIDDAASPTQKGKWLAMFFMAAPVGQALGYALGGTLCAALDSERLGFASWRAAFLLEGAAMLPVAALCAFLDNTVGGARGKGAGGGRDSPGAAGGGGGGGGGGALAMAGSILGNGVWCFAVLGYGAFTFVIGAFAVWGPSYVQSRFGAPLDEADLYFGGTAVLTGLLGTSAGGVLMDAATRGFGGDVQSSSLLVTLLLTIVAWPLCVATFVVPSTMGSFFALLFLGQFFAFATTSPLNGVILWSVEPHQRVLSMALAVVAMHLLGDVPSPIIVGAMLERFSDKSLVMTSVALWLGWCVVLWGGAFCLARRRARRLEVVGGGMDSPLLLPEG